MSPSEAWSTIELRLAAEWDQMSAPIAWPGVSFSPPNGKPWLRPTPMFGDGAEATHSLHSVVGVLDLSLFGPRGSGYGTLRTLAEAAQDLFASQTIDGLRFGAASGPEIGPDPALLHLIVRVPFTVDEAR